MARGSAWNSSMVFDDGFVLATTRRAGAFIYLTKSSTIQYVCSRSFSFGWTCAGVIPFAWITHACETGARPQEAAVRRQPSLLRVAAHAVGLERPRSPFGPSEWLALLLTAQSSSACGATRPRLESTECASQPRGTPIPASHAPQPANTTHLNMSTDAVPEGLQLLLHRSLKRNTPGHTHGTWYAHLDVAHPTHIAVHSGIQRT